jgi:hypothetical protein
MTSPPAVADLAAAIIAEQAPIVFPDTAAILDILRASFRHEIKANVVESAVDLTEASLATPKRLWLVAPDIVMGEFDNHREKVKKEMVSHLKRFSETIARVHEISKIVFAEWQFAAVDLIEMGLEARVTTVLDRFVMATNVFSGSDLCHKNARRRVWEDLPPARPEKQSYKDCEIFEACLELLSTLRAAGFSPAAVFVTPNAADYGPPPDGFPNIGSELAVLNATYTKDLSWAKSKLKIS